MFQEAYRAFHMRERLRMEQMTPKARPPVSFGFAGGQVCLDFANTVGGLRGAVAEDSLTSYADLVAWSQQAGLLSESIAGALLAAAANAPGEADATLERACALREAIYGVFSARVSGTPTAADLEVLNREIEQGMSGAHLVAATAGFSWAWRVDEHTFDHMLGTIARSAATLLTSAEVGLVRQCASEACGWLFLDTTKNHRRQWCSMTGCGNKARVRRHRQRKRIGERPT